MDQFISVSFVYSSLTHYIVIFTVLGLSKWRMVRIFIGTNLVWTLSAYVSRVSFAFPTQLDKGSR